MKIYNITKEERDRISGIHSINESSSRENAWKNLIDIINYKSTYIGDLLDEFKLNKVTNTGVVVDHTKRFMIDRLKNGYFNKITVDGSGGGDFAIEVSNFIIKEVTNIINNLSGFFFLTLNEKDIDNTLSKVDFDYIFESLMSTFNYGDIIVGDNIDPYIDKGIRFDTEFRTKFMTLTPKIKNTIVTTIKGRL